MAIKVIIIKDKPIDQLVLTQEITTIGRRSDCDISIKDPAVSGHHAQIQKISGNYVIQDMGSTNGVHLGGKKIQQQVLKNNDIVQIGEHQLKFLMTEESTVQVKRDMEARELAKKPAPKPIAGAGEAVLAVLSGANAGEVISLIEGLTTIGEPGVQVAAISRRPQGHFIIHVDGGKDRERVPLVNGEPTGFKSRKLEVGDKIEVAGIQMEYRVD